MNPFKTFYLNRKLVGAVEKNDVQGAFNLLARGAAAAAVSFKKLGLPVLHIAAQNGNEAMTMALLAGGADVHTTDISRTTALHEAAKSGNTGVMAALLAQGAVIDARTGDGHCALHYAALYGHTSAALMLLDRKANIDIRNAQGETALHMSMGSKNAALPALLIDRGADIRAANNYNWTPLHFAAFHGDTAMAALLLDQGIDITIRSIDGNKTAYGLAIQRQHNDIIDLIAPHEIRLQEARDNQWMMISDKKVARLYTEGEGDIGCALQKREITELFNFRTRRYKAWSRNLSTNAETFITRGFDDLYRTKESAILDEAYAEMVRLCKDARRPEHSHAAIVKALDAATPAAPAH